MTQEEDSFYFTDATLDDVKDIVRINNSYLDTSDETGFILRKLNLIDVEYEIKRELNNYYVIKEKRETVLAYARLEMEIEDILLKDLNWKNEDFKYRFFSTAYLLVDQIATKRGNRRKGIGKFLYESLINKYINKSFASFIANKPFSNTASMNFHKKMGFKQVATFRSLKFFDLTDYESYLFVYFR